jgi:hypothetical protein
MGKAGAYQGRSFGIGKMAFTKTLFGNAVFGKTLFGKMLFGKTFFGKILFGKHYLAKCCWAKHYLVKLYSAKRHLAFGIRHSVTAPPSASSFRSFLMVADSNLEVEK